MIITDFSHGCIGEAAALAMMNYNEERRHVPALPGAGEVPDLTLFAGNGLGAAAYESGRMTGFLCCYDPRDNAFGTTYAKGTFSPVHAHGAVAGNRKTIYKRLYQAAAAKWVNAGIVSHAVALYAHDIPAISAFFEYGFGMRCVDAVRPMETIPCDNAGGYTFSESDCTGITHLRNMLIDHLAASPCFLKYPHMTDVGSAGVAARRNSRIFRAEKDGATVAFMEVTDRGENFACDDISMKNICGAFCMPGHRGCGLYQNLLNYMINILRGEGYTRLGVDFESINPTAYGFWLKYFGAYTYSVVRRVDERITES